jgi:hypothetical protein
MRCSSSVLAHRTYTSYGDWPPPPHPLRPKCCRPILIATKVMLISGQNTGALH